MYRLFRFCFTSLLLLALFVPLLVVHNARATPRVVLDGQTITFDVPPVIEQGRTLVPLRTIFEALGCTVEWDPESATVIATKGHTTTIKLTVGDSIAYKDGQRVHLDVPSKLIRGRTMVPLRFLSEALGASVSWDEATQTVTILTQPEAAGPSLSLVSSLVEARVTKVVDGDTIYVELPQGRQEKVRFIGVNTPESTIAHEPYSKEASAYTARRLSGATVYLEKDVQERDKYGRLLAYVWLAPPEERSEQEIRRKMFNAELLREGYAQVMTVPPNVKYVEVFLKLQREAREAGEGLWSLEDQTPETNPSQLPSVLAGQHDGVRQGAAVNQQDASQKTVYITKSGSKYHRDGCKYLSKSKIPISLKEAKRRGLEPCLSCRPGC